MPSSRCVCLIVISYFAYHAAFMVATALSPGSRCRTHVSELSSQQLNEVRQSREQLDRQVALLRPESLDPDLLDERARATLDLVHPDDIVIFS